MSAPRARDVLGAAAAAAKSGVERVEASALPCFEVTAAELAATYAARHSASSTNGFAEALQAALAKMAGYETGKPPDRSLLTNTENYVTCHYAAGLEIHSISYVWNFLRRSLPAEICDAFKGMQLVADGDGAVFDAPARAKAQVGELDGVTADVPEMPRLKERASFGSPGGRGGRGGKGGRSPGGKGGKGGRGRGRGGGKGGGRGRRY